MLLEILIPTFNREEDLKKNLNILASQIQKISDFHEIRVIISDNASTDDTVLFVKALQLNFPTELLLLQSSENTGLEKNVVKILSNARAEWVMFLGDDDFLPDGYIEFVIKTIKNENVGCIIAGFSHLYKDGSTNIARGGKELKTQPGFSSVLKLSQFGHQLSGLVIKNNELILKTYLENQQFRNIYLFIYFVAFNLLHENGIYVPQYQVLVSQGNTKDWKYDDSGLLTEIYLNYLILFKNQPFKGIISCLFFTYQQKWRLRYSKNPFKTLIAFRQITFTSVLPLLLKITIVCVFVLYYPFWIIYLVVIKLLRIIKSKIN